MIPGSTTFASAQEERERIPMTMSEQQIRSALQQYWPAPAAGDPVAEHDFYEENTVCEYGSSNKR